MAELNRLFVEMMNMAVSASWLIAALLLLRPLLKRIAPKWMVCTLWALVAVRLVLPASLLHSDLSVYRLAGDAVQESGQVAYFESCPDTDHIAVGYTPATLLPGADLRPLQTTDAIASLTAARDYTQGGLPLLWIMGVLILLAAAVVGYILIRDDVAASVPLGGRVYVCDEITTPFILGVLRPRIYLTSGMDGAARRYVLLHEEAHLRRGDHIWKPLGYLLLVVYWYDPLVWAAYICFCRDMELACDERVIRSMAAAERAGYSQTLLDCACGRRWVTACPLAFGEVGVKARVKAVLRHKKPAMWAVLAAVVLCVVLAVAFLTDPKAAEPVDPMDTTDIAASGADIKTGTEDETFFLLGHYEQDGDTSNGAETIEWQIMRWEKDRVLLVSRFCLDYQSYTPYYQSVEGCPTWAESSLRTWLNTEFLSTAFTAGEQEKLLTTTVTTIQPDGGQVVTEDTVFLLSDSEVRELFATEADAAASPTAYARRKDEVQGEDTDAYASDALRPAVSWWLRSTDGGNHPDAVWNTGAVGEGFRSYEPDYIRPAVWITLTE